MLTGPGFLITFLYYFSCTSLIVILLAWQGLGLSLDTSLPYELASLVGLIAGLGGAYFNRSLSISTEFKNQKAFLKTLNQILAEMGYQEPEKIDDFTVYKKANQKTLFSEKIRIKVELHSATIIGRSSTMKHLRQKFNVHKK